MDDYTKQERADLFTAAVCAMLLLAVVVGLVFYDLAVRGE